MHRMRIFIFFLIVLSALIMVKDIAHSDGDLSCIRPVLTSEFGVICTIEGIIFTVDNDKEKAPEKNIYVKIRKVNGQNRNATLKCVGFDTHIDKFLADFTKTETDNIIKLNGFESVVADGLPDNMRKYYYVLVPSAKRYKITNIFVVVAEPLKGNWERPQMAK